MEVVQAVCMHCKLLVIGVPKDIGLRLQGLLLNAVTGVDRRNISQVIALQRATAKSSQRQSTFQRITSLWKQISQGEQHLPGRVHATYRSVAAMIFSSELMCDNLECGRAFVGGEVVVRKLGK